MSVLLRLRYWRGCVAPLAVMLLMSAATAWGEVAPLTVREVAPGFYVHQGANEDATPENRGDIANIGFIVGKDAVAVIDTGGTYNLGRRLRAAVRRVTDVPIGYVINTHVHPDHIFGNAAFADESPTYVGHARLASAMRDTAPYYLPQLRRNVGEEEAAGSVIVPPGLHVSIDTPLVIDLGERPLVLRAWPTHHSPTDLTIYDETTRTLWAGSVFVARIPSITGSLLGYIDVLEEMKDIPAVQVIPGNGPAPAPWPQAVDPMLRYFNVLVEGIRDILARGGDIQEATAHVGQSEKAHWLLFDAYNGGNVTAGFTELEWED